MSHNKMLFTCEWCNQDYCAECCENEDWEHYCSKECEVEKVKEDGLEVKP